MVRKDKQLCVRDKSKKDKIKKFYEAIEIGERQLQEVKVYPCTTAIKNAKKRKPINPDVIPA